MSGSSTTNWDVLLGTRRSTSVMTRFATNKLSARETSQEFSFSNRAGEFRRLVRTYGTVYARRLTRKALRYRGILAPTS